MGDTKANISLQEIKQAVTQVFARATLPSAKEEAWRKIRLGGIDFSSFDSKSSRSEMDIKVSATPGLRVLSFAEAMEDPQIKSALLGHLQQSLGEAQNYDYFRLHNLAQSMQARVLHISENLQDPLVVRHILGQGNTLIHRLFVYIEANVQATVIEDFSYPKQDAGIDGQTTEPQATYWNSDTVAFVAKNATFSYVCLRNYSNDVYHFQRFTSEQRRDSQVFFNLAHCGGLLGKGFVQARLLEANAEFRGLGLFAGADKDFHDIEMVADHRCEHTRSSLLYKAVLRERAHSVFDGQLNIPFGIKFVESQQTNHNILLDSQARAESMPRLRIQAEDVTCEHGATVGALDPEVLFYLLSRGLSEQEAHYLMIEGFVSEVLDQFPLSEANHQNILAKLKAKLKL